MSSSRTSSQLALHRSAIITAVATFFLLIAGGLVTSTDSGLAVPDWPLSYGMWFPPMVGGIFYEHGHRMIAATVGLMVLVLAMWLWKRERRRWVRRLGYTAFAAVVGQGLLGGLTVRLLLPAPISIAHACLGQAVFCLVVAIAWCTSPAWDDRRAWPESIASNSLGSLSLAVAGLAALQLLLGAVIRHTGLGVAWHAINAVAVSGAAVWLAQRIRSTRQDVPHLWRSARRLLVLLLAQWLLGVSVWTHRASVELRTGHVALGALVLAQGVLLAWAVRRHQPLHPPTAAGSLKEYLALTKPRLSALVICTTAAGFWLGLPEGASPATLAPLLLGTALVVGGANAFNQWSERDADARMHRTRHRPLPSGRLSPRRAWQFAWGCSIAGVVLLAVLVNWLTAALAVLSWVSYGLVYTPLKRVTPLCTLVGAIPGALPPLMGWAGARGALGAQAWALFAILFVWQLPHFLALATIYREDYARAGFKMLPLIEPDGLIAARQIALYGLALLPASLAPTLMGTTGTRYFFGALALSLAFCLVALHAAWARSPRSAQRLFRTSVLYLPLLLGLLVWDKAPL